MGIEELILTFSYIAILFLMTVNGFISFPSSQILYIVAGYFVSTGNLNFFMVILIGGLGHTIGNLILYEISRRKGVLYSLKFFKYIFPVEHAERIVRQIHVAFKKRGVLFLFIGKLVNPIKIFIPIPAGIAKMNRTVFFCVAYVASVLWAAAFTAIGYYFGKSFSNFTIYGLVMLVLFVSVTYFFYRYINSDEVLREVDGKK